MGALSGNSGRKVATMTASGEVKTGGFATTGAS